MATTVIGNNCLAGAAAGLMGGRFLGSATPANYLNIKNAAAAIQTEFLTVNAASAAPIADADNANIGTAVYAAAMATILNSGATSVTATDYLALANQIYALAAEIKTGLA
jgi:hypothetical protein